MNIRDLLQRLNKLFITVISKELCKVGLTAPQIMVLKQIADEPKTIGDISKAIDLSYSTVSGIIDRLEKSQLVERTRDVSDRRVIWIRKTNKIEEIMKQVPVFQDDYYTNLFSDLSQEERNHIVKALKLLLTELEKKVEEKP